MTDKLVYKDYPFDEIVAACEEHVKNGSIIHQKFSCEKCGNRLTIEEPNRLYTSGKCDNCGHVTDIQKRGCNYLLITRSPKE